MWNEDMIQPLKARFTTNNIKGWSLKVKWQRNHMICFLFVKNPTGNLDSRCSDSTYKS